MTRHLHNLWWDLHHDHAFAAVAVSLWTLWWVIVCALTWMWWPRRRKDRTGRRPRWYKPRHRADTHEGVTIHSRPLLELMPAAGHLRAADPVATVASLEADLDEIEAAASDQPIEWSDEYEAAWLRFTTRLDRVEQALKDPHPVTAYKALAVDEPTGSFSRVELHRLLGEDREPAKLP